MVRQSRLPNLKSLAQVVFEILRSKHIRVMGLTCQGHVTIRYGMSCHFLLVVLWNQTSMYNGFRDIQRHM